MKTVFQKPLFLLWDEKGGVMKQGCRIAAVYSGISYQRGILIESDYRKNMEVIPVNNLENTDLTDYDVLIFPRGTDEEVALKNSKRIEDFLNDKKVVISFGEIPRNWLPGSQWGGVTPEDDGPLRICRYIIGSSGNKLHDIETRHELFEGIENHDLHWHKGATGWCCHGHLIPPAGSEVLVINEAGATMMYLDRNTTAGTMLISSQLDAMCHAYHGVEGAKKLLDNCLVWVKKEVTKLRKVL